jgi:serpin B
MGMSQAFKPGADFWGIVKQDAGLDIYLGQVLHKARIDVDEQKTEAAAVTVVEVIEVEKSVDKEPTPSPIMMEIERPFIFVIRDIETNTILFVGREMNPAQ